MQQTADNMRVSRQRGNEHWTSIPLPGIIKLIAPGAGSTLSSNAAVLGLYVGTLNRSLSGWFQGLSIFPQRLSMRHGYPGFVGKNRGDTGNGVPAAKRMVSVGSASGRRSTVAVETRRTSLAERVFRTHSGTPASKKMLWYGMYPGLWNDLTSRDRQLKNNTSANTYGGIDSNTFSGSESREGRRDNGRHGSGLLLHSAPLKDKHSSTVDSSRDMNLFRRQKTSGVVSSSVAFSGKELFMVNRSNSILKTSAKASESSGRRARTHFYARGYLPLTTAPFTRNQKLLPDLFSGGMRNYSTQTNGLGSVTQFPQRASGLTSLSDRNTGSIMPFSDQDGFWGDKGFYIGGGLDKARTPGHQRASGKNVTVNVNRSLIDHFSVHQAAPDSGMNEVRNKVEEVLLEILSSANVIN